MLVDNAVICVLELEVQQANNNDVLLLEVQQPATRWVWVDDGVGKNGWV